MVRIIKYDSPKPYHRNSVGVKNMPLVTKLTFLARKQIVNLVSFCWAKPHLLKIKTK